MTRNCLQTRLLPQATESILTAPSVQKINNKSFDASIDNTINNNPPTSTLTQANDTSNSKISPDKNITPLVNLSQKINLHLRS